MPWTRLAAVLVLSLTCLEGAAAPGDADARAFAVPNSQVVDLPTAPNGVDYQLYVDVPPPCRNTDRPCPTVYLLDAEYSFPLAATIVTHLADRQRIPPLVVVAIGYPDKSHDRRDRTRDYTPFFHPDGGYSARIQKDSGGGPAFLSVLTHQIVPFVEGHFPGAGHPRTLVGHSYGGLFAVYAWMHAPAAFEKYVLVSPSLWYGDHAPLRAAQQTCERDAFAPERDVFLAVGEYEEQSEIGRPMVSDLKALQNILDHCRQRNVSTYLRVFPDESHASIFPAALSTGLRRQFEGG